MDDFDKIDAEIDSIMKELEKINPNNVKDDFSSHKVNEGIPDFDSFFNDFNNEINSSVEPIRNPNFIKNQETPLEFQEVSIGNDEINQAYLKKQEKELERQRIEKQKQQKLLEEEKLKQQQELEKLKTLEAVSKPKKRVVKKEKKRITLPKISLPSLFKKKPKVDKPKAKPEVIETPIVQPESKPIIETIKSKAPSIQKPKKLRIKKERVKKQRVEKEKTIRPKASKPVFAFAVIMSIIVSLCVVGAIGAGIFAIKLCDGIPTLNKADLVSPDSSIIYDNEGNKIMEVGMYLRENIDYEEMPNCLIDAFLAVEDSRFYEHIGFDIPRFTKAALVNLSTGDFSQGGSTVTMQLIKNSYFSIDADDQSTIAAREGMSGIKRKMQEIVLAIELDLFKQDVTKQEILAMYINKVNYGNNIRGVEKAAEYYFGKRASSLSLPEAAFLAGIINSPNTYNPYNDLYKNDSIYLDPESEYLQNATQRRNEVLNLMVQHGYISKDEANLAKSVRMEDLLIGVKESFTETNAKYQGYIDAVLDEIEEMTGESAYQVGMDVYTNMNPYMQTLLYDMQNEEEYTGIEFPNDLCQSAIVLLDNQTGAVEALGGGRGETENARQFNRATSAYLNPGSSIKPVVDYSLAIEHLGWATCHTITDQPFYLYNGNILVTNYDSTYYGDMLMTEALGRSQNTPAVQTLKAVVAELGEDKVVDYLNSIGFNIDYEDFDLQFAIGGNRCLATPLQMAAAHAIFINNGKYVKPHTINYIKYVDGRDDYVADTAGVQALSPEAAWMTAYLEYYNMYGDFSSLMWYCQRDYPLYGKTGTTDWAEAGVDYGIPAFSTKDSWLVMQTNRYTISCWTGYDELTEGAYFKQWEYQENTKSKIVAKILDELETHASYKDYDPTIELVKPDGVKEIRVEKGTWPYVLSSGGVSGYIKEDFLEKNTGSMEQAYAYASSNNKYVDAGISNINGSYDGNKVHITFDTGSGEGGLLSGDSVDLSTTNLYGETTHAAGRIYFPHWNTIYTGHAEPPYFYRVTVNGAVTEESSTGSHSFSADAPGGEVARACLWTDGSNESCIDIPKS